MEFMKIWHVSASIVSQSQLFGVGLLVSLAISLVLAQLRGIPKSDGVILLVITLVGAFSGAWVGGLVLGDTTGFVTSGALLGGALTAWGACALRPQFWFALDILVPSLLVALGLTRLGCIFEGCDFGASSTWGIQYWPGSPAEQAGLRTTLPFPVFAAFSAFTAAIVGIVYRSKPTAAAAAATLTYLILRFLSEFARSDATLGVALPFLNVNQWVSLGGVAMVSVWAWRLRTKA